MEDFNDKLNEDLDEDLNEGLDEGLDEQTEDSDDDIEYEYDDDGNIIIPDEEESESTEDTADNGDKETAPDATEDTRDAEIARLKKELAARDSQIKDTLKSLGENEELGVEGLEKLAAEAQDITLEEYREKRAKATESAEAVELLRKQRFEEKIKADLDAVHAAYPETKQYATVYDFPNFAKFSKYRDLGLPADEAYIAANPRSVMASVAESANTAAASLRGSKEHLRSNVPVASRDNSIKISKREMDEYKDLFPKLSEKEIIALHKQTIKK